MQRLIKATCAIVAEEIGIEKGYKIACAAQKRYEELLDSQTIYENISEKFWDRRRV